MATCLATRGSGPCRAALHSCHRGRAPRARGKPRRAGSLAGLLSPDGKRLVSASEDRTAKLWDVHGGKEVLSPPGPYQRFDQRRLQPRTASWQANSSDDQTLRSWAARSGQPLQSVHPGGTPLVVAFSPDGHRLAAGCAASVVVYELAERLGRQLPGHRQFSMALAVHPRKPLLASASRRSVVSLEDAGTGEELRTWDFAGPPGQARLQPGRAIARGSVPCAPNPTYQSMGNKDVYLVDTENGKTRKLVLGDVSCCRRIRPGRPAAGGRAPERSRDRLQRAAPARPCTAGSRRMAGSPRSRCAAAINCSSGEVGGSLRLCDMVDGRTIRELRLPRGLVRFVVEPRRATGRRSRSVRNGPRSQTPRAAAGRHNRPVGRRRTGWAWDSAATNVG